ncbi:MAG: hypothetical protein ABIU11_06600 [Chitinophagaceae bacterium]
MKKIALILLISMYALSSFGIGIEQFYCCGTLKSTSISFLREVKEKCSKGDEKNGCCQTQFTSLKVKDTHIPAGAISSSVNIFPDIVLFNSPFDGVELLTHQTIVNNPGHAPPLLKDTPLYILNCNFLI